MRSARVATAVIGMALIVSACGGGSTGDAGTPATQVGPAPATDVSPATDAVAEPAAEQATSDPTAIDPAPTDPAPAVVVPAALQFSAPLVGGGELDASSLAGKPTVFWFWAPT